MGQCPIWGWVGKKTDFDQTLKVGSWAHQEQIPTVR